MRDLARDRGVVAAFGGTAAAALGVGALVGVPTGVKIALACVAASCAARGLFLLIFDTHDPMKAAAETTAAAAAAAVAAYREESRGAARPDGAQQSTEGPVVFVCSSTTDEDWRHRFVGPILAPWTQEHGVGVWSQVRGLRTPTVAERDGAIARSEVALLLVTEAFLAAERVKAECAALRASGVPLRAVLCEACAWEDAEQLQGVGWWREPPLAPVDLRANQDAEIIRACGMVVGLLPALPDEEPPRLDETPTDRGGEPRFAGLTGHARPGELHGVPALPAGFVARAADLAALRGAVLDAGDGAIGITGRALGITGRALGLHGRGGIGKTVLATALAHDPQTRAHFPDGVYWVTVGERPNLVAAQLALLERLGVDAGEVRSAASGAKLLEDALQQARCLLIIDDVWSVAAAQAFRAVGPGARVLYTSRDENVLKRVDASVQRLDVLPKEAALELLATVSRTPVGEWPRETSRVLQATGRVALALALVAAAVGRGGRTWPQIADDLDQAAGTFLAHPYADTFKAMQVNVATLDAPAAAAYQALAVYPPDTRIPWRAVARLWAAEHAQTGKATRALLRLLDERELLTLEDQDRGAVSFHDLQREFLLLQVSDLSLLHADLLSAYRRLLPAADRPWHDLPPGEPYIWAHLPYHLQGAGDEAGLLALTRDLGYLVTRCHQAGNWAVSSTLRAARERHPDDPVTAWLLRLFGQRAHLLARCETPADLAATITAHSGDAPPRVDLATLGALAPDVMLRARWGHTQPAALLRTLEGHTDRVRALAWAPDGQQLASASDDDTLRLWDPATGQPTATLQGHTNWVRALAWAPDGQQLASASGDGTLRLWDPATGQPTATLQGHTNWVRALAWAPDGQQLASASNDGTLRLWDPATGQPTATLQGHTGWVRAVAWAPDGQQLASASIDGTLRLWDPATGQPTATLQGHTSAVRAVAWAPDRPAARERQPRRHTQALGPRDRPTHRHPPRPHQRGGGGRLGPRPPAARERQPRRHTQALGPRDRPTHRHPPRPHQPGGGARLGPRRPAARERQRRRHGQALGSRSGALAAAACGVAGSLGGGSPELACRCGLGGRLLARRPAPRQRRRGWHGAGVDRARSACLLYPARRRDRRDRVGHWRHRCVNRPASGAVRRDRATGGCGLSFPRGWFCWITTEIQRILGGLHTAFRQAAPFAQSGDRSRFLDRRQIVAGPCSRSARLERQTVSRPIKIAARHRLCRELGFQFSHERRRARAPSQRDGGGQPRCLRPRANREGASCRMRKRRARARPRSALDRRCRTPRRPTRARVSLSDRAASVGGAIARGRSSRPRECSAHPRYTSPDGDCRHGPQEDRPGCSLGIFASLYGTRQVIRPLARLTVANAWRQEARGRADSAHGAVFRKRLLT